jgi:hypothetical protein
METLKVGTEENQWDREIASLIFWEDGEVKRTKDSNKLFRW